MKKSVWLISFYLLSIITYSQTIQVNTYYNADSTQIKESYFVLENDTSLLDGVYLRYSENGELLTKSFYSEGKQQGEWFELRRDGLVHMSGLFYNNLFSGYNYFYDDKGDYKHTDYYYYDTLITVSDSLLNIEISGNINKLKAIGFFDDNLMAKKQSIITANKNQYDTISIMDEKIAFGNKLLNSLSNYSIWYTLYKDAKDELLCLKQEIGSYKLPLNDSLLETQRDNYSGIVAELLKTDSILLVVKKQPFMSGKFDELKQQAKTLLEIQTKIDESFTKFKRDGVDLPDEIIKAYQDYNSAKQIADKISVGNRLINDIDSFLSQYSSISNIKRTIDELNRELEKNYKKDYPVVFKSVQLDIDNKIKAFHDETDLSKRSEKGNRLIAELESVKNDLARLDSIDLIIDEETSSLSDNYLLSYPSIYSKEIKALNQSIDEYYLISKLNDKIAKSKQLADTLRYYNDAYSRFIAIDKYIDENYEHLKPVYKQQYRQIYKTEFPQINNIIKKYKLIANAESKLDVGNELLEKIKHLEQNAILIGAQEQMIDSIFAVVVSKYKENYPSIAKMELRTYQSKITAFKKIPSSDARLTRGNEILKDIDFFLEKFDVLQKQSNEIDSKLRKIEADYQIQFPSIYKMEIKESRDNIKSYNSMVSIANKLKLGNIILERFDILNDAFPVLKEENDRITKELPSLKDGYKDNFPLLYKKHFSILSAEMKEYKASGYVKNKTVLSNNLIKKIDELAEQYTELKVQSDFINSAYNDFVMYYQNRKPVKNIFSKGKSAYKEMKKNYDAELNFDKKIKKGKEIEEMLQKLISITNDDNTKLNKRIRSVKSVQDFLKSIGL